MRPAALASVTALACLAVHSPRPAHACGSGGDADALVVAAGLGLGLAITDVGFSIHDLVVEDSSQTYATFETILTVPQAVIMGAVTISAFNDEYASTDDKMLALGLFAWTSALAIHGIWELSKDDPSPQPDHFTVLPTAVTDGAHVGGGLGVGGSW